MAVSMRIWTRGRKGLVILNEARFRRFMNTDVNKRLQAKPNSLDNRVAFQLTTWMKYYEDIIGITDVKEAQRRVLVEEQKFLDNQEQRRERQRQIQLIQLKLKEIQLELDKTLRGEDRYLQLVTQEHSILKEERNLSDEFKFYEKGERECFSALSSAVRDSHEKERAYAEKTKYWSIIGSVCGAIIGIMGTTMNNWVRMRELRDLVHGIDTSSTMPKLQAMFTQMTDTLTSQQQQITSAFHDIQEVLDERFRTTSNDVSSKGTTMIDNIYQCIKRQDEHLQEEMSEIKALLTARQIMSDDEGATSRGAVIYLGRDVEHLVKEAQHNLEWKIKINSLATVAMIYGAFAVSIPILYKIFSGTT